MAASSRTASQPAVPITARQIDEIITWTPNEGDLVHTARQLAYEGYNAELIAGKVYEYIKRSDVNIRHVYCLIAFGLTRGFGGGKTWAMILQKTNNPATLKAAVEGLSVKLGKPRLKSVVTIPRILQSVPFLTFKVFCILSSRQLVKDTEPVGDLYYCYRWIGSPAVMNKAHWDRFRESYITFSVGCSVIWGKEQSREEALKFATLSYNSTVFPVSSRPTNAVLDAFENVIRIGRGLIVPALSLEEENAQRALAGFPAVVHTRIGTAMET